MSLQLQPMTIGEARVFVTRNHRHNTSPPGAKFAIAVSDDGEVVGVVLVGRPIARMFDDDWTAEVSRCCVLEGHRNACSMLYGAAWRAARAMGYKRMVTYTRIDEEGGSLRAAGWRIVGQTRAQSWHRHSRPRVDTTDITQRNLWEVRAFRRRTEVGR